MKNSLIIITLSVLVFSCKKDLTELNRDTKRPSEVPAPTLFSNAQKNLADAVTSSNVNLNIFRLISQYWTQTTYTDESRYDLSTRNIPQNFWNTLYRDVLRDLQEARVSTEAQQGSDLDTAQQTNQLAMINIMEVYTWSVLVNTFGDVPYNEALDYERVQPAYDDAQEIYNDLLGRLDTAIGSLDADEAGFGSSDLLYQGNVSQWIKFGNSLRLKLGMMLADVDQAMAKEHVEEAAAGSLFESNGDNATFQYLESPPNTNPIWVDLVQSGRKDFVAANTIVDVMNDIEDPRREFYFTESNTDDFKGGTYGTSNNYATFSKPSTMITSPDFEGILMDYSEVEFLLAEAVERGFNVEGSAEEHYENAIEASILYWGGTQEQAETYLAQPEVAYGSATGDWKQKIGTQKWLALYNRGFDAWTEWRRLDFPDLQPPAGLNEPIPVRFTYPVLEQNLNRTNYEAAAAAIGGDVVSTKLFWDLQ
jgi:hypothetical protein